MKKYMLIMKPAIEGSRTCPPREIEYGSLEEALDSLEQTVRDERGEEGATDEEIEEAVKEAREGRSYWGGNYDYCVKEED